MIRENGIWKCECGKTAIHKSSIGFMCEDHGVQGMKEEYKPKKITFEQLEKVKTILNNQKGN